MAEEQAARSEAEIMRQVVQLMIKRLPAGWAGDLRAGSVDGDLDGVLKITAPDGVSAKVILEVRRVIEGRDVAMLRERMTRRLRPPYDGVLIASRYLPLQVRRRLAETGFSYADITGNVHVSLARPGLYIADRGADRDPWRGPGRPRGTLKGEPAARVVRALIDFGGPWKIRELIDVARASTGSTYRVVEFLQGEELLKRDPSGQLWLPDWVRLLRRWSQDYGFVRNSRVTRWIAPRGLPALLRRAAAASHVRYAMTGTLAAAGWAAYAPARSAMIYTADAPQAAEEWGLHPADAGANVMLAEPEADVVYERTAAVAGVICAAPAQVAVDLMTGPGRGPSEAEELLEWMTRNEASWRH